MPTVGYHRQRQVKKEKLKSEDMSKIIKNPRRRKIEGRENLVKPYWLC
jgi:hypothetical protein